MDDMTAERLAKRLNVTRVIREISDLLERAQALIVARTDRQEILRKLEHAYAMCLENGADIGFRDGDTGISIDAIKIIVDDLNFQILNGVARLYTCLAVGDGETEDDIDAQTFEEFRSMMTRIAIPLHNILSSSRVRITPPITDAA